MEIVRSEKSKRYISMLVCIVLICTVFFGNTVESNAELPNVTVNDAGYIRAIFSAYGFIGSGFGISNEARDLIKQVTTNELDTSMWKHGYYWDKESKKYESAISVPKSDMERIYYLLLNYIGGYGVTQMGGVYVPPELSAAFSLSSIPNYVKSELDKLHYPNAIVYNMDVGIWKIYVSEQPIYFDRYMSGGTGMRFYLSERRPPLQFDLRFDINNNLISKTQQTPPSNAVIHLSGDSPVQYFEGQIFIERWTSDYSQMIKQYIAVSNQREISPNIWNINYVLPDGVNYSGWKTQPDGNVVMNVPTKEDENGNKVVDEAAAENLTPDKARVSEPFYETGRLGEMGTEPPGLIGSLLKELLSFIKNLLSDVVNFSFDGLLDAPMQTVTERSGINSFNQSFKAFDNMQKGHGEPPKIYINLNKLVGTAQNVGGFNNQFADQDTLLIDFAKLEEIQFMGMTLIQLIRSMMSLAMISITVFYIYRKFAPQTII